MTKKSQQRGSQRSCFQKQLQKKGWVEGAAFDAELRRLMNAWENSRPYAVTAPAPPGVRAEDQMVWDAPARNAHCHGLCSQDGATIVVQGFYKGLAEIRHTSTGECMKTLKLDASVDDCFCGASISADSNFLVTTHMFSATAMVVQAGCARRRRTR